MDAALKTLNEQQAIEAWSLVHEDGRVLATFKRPGGADAAFLDELGASLLASARGLAAELGKGKVEEALIEYPEGPVLVQPVGEQAMLLVLLKQLADLGRVRLLLRRLGPELEALV